jgi:hypothetical protein
VIVVLGRPTLAAAPLDGQGSDSPDADGGQRLAGRAASVALACRAAGGAVELVGAVTDNDNGDAIVLALGRAGIGHAAVLRDPSAGQVRFDAADVSLGLSYVADCRVLVVAEPLADDALAVAADAAAYHGAHLIAVLATDAVEPATSLPAETTLLREPSNEGADPTDVDDFADAVGRYAAELDRGEPPAEAFRRALGGDGEPVAD